MCFILSEPELAYLSVDTMFEILHRQRCLSDFAPINISEQYNLPPSLYLYSWKYMYTLIYFI